jgi:hypothetical protein
MSKKPKIRITAPPQRSPKTKHIKNLQIKTEYKQAIGHGQYLNFSFKLLDLSHKDFNVSGCERDWFIQLFERKKNLCGMTFDEIQRGGKTTRCHPISWKETSVPEGFNIPELSPDILSFQLSISQTKGRIFGFVIDNVFYVVWFDPEHKVYNSRN